MKVQDKYERDHQLMHKVFIGGLLFVGLGLAGIVGSIIMLCK
ncbi:hypothetical protein [Parapedobacter soli]|nr:hypothetical protein [Parapedobacter soli]